MNIKSFYDLNLVVMRAKVGARNYVTILCFFGYAFIWLCVQCSYIVLTSTCITILYFYFMVCEKKVGNNDDKKMATMTISDGGYFDFKVA